MRENYTPLSGSNPSRRGTGNHESDHSPGRGFALTRTLMGSGFNNVFSSNSSLFFRFRSNLALLASVLFLMLSFTNVNAQCTAAPVVVGVGDLTATSAVLNWNTVTGVSGGTYTVDVATDSGFSTILTTASAVATTRYQVTGLTENTTYYFRVKVDNTSCGTYSAATSFIPKRGVYTTLATTGYASDVIANGVGVPSGSTTADIDGGNFSYVAMDYQLNASSNLPVANSGLPINRVLNTALGVQFYMQDYTGSNSLRLPTNGNSGTITLAYPQKFGTIYVAVTSGSGNAALTPVLNFTDGTTYTASATTLVNWDNAATTAVPACTNANTLGRITRTSATATAPTSTGAFKVFYFTIAVPLSYQTKQLNSITFTKGGATGAVAQIFGLSGKTLDACPVMTSVTSAAVSTSSFTANWTLGSLGSDGATPTYTLEVYTDSGYTTPVSGSPFTGLTGNSYTLTGLTPDATYYYRVKADGSSCSSSYVTGSQSLAYCSVTTSTTYYNTNFTTIGGASNISNSTAAATANYSATQIVSVQAGSSFTYTGSKAAGTTATGIFVDWNDDLDFADAGETIAIHTGALSGGLTLYSGTISVPAGAAIGSHRLRVRSVIYSSTPSGCSVTGETEDYTLNVTASTGACTAPLAPASISFSGLTSSNINVNITAATTPPTGGYLVVRSTSASLSSDPVSGTSYAVGSTIGGGTVVALSSTASSVSSFVASNTRYYFYVYAFNNGSCVGPVYSTAVTGNATSCATAAVSSAASNVKNSFATLNWASVKGTNGNPVTYTVEVYTDAALTTLFGTYTLVDQLSYNITDLTANATYYYRVKAEVPAGCGDATFSSTINFKAENNYSPINLTGFNADVIAEGNGWATISTTSDVDGGGYVYMSRDYKPNVTSAALSTGALPVNRTMASPNNTGLNFLMPDYKTNNSVRLTAASPSQDLVFSVPTKLTNLYLAVASGGGASSITGTIYFEDDTTQAIASTAVPDWFATSGAPVLAYNIGRVNKNGTTNEAEFTTTTGISQSNAKIFQLTIAIPSANQGKKVTKVNITRVASGTAVPNIFAISGQVIGDCPTLSAVTAAAASATSATVSWTLSSQGDGGVPTYTVTTYLDAALTTLVSTNSGISGTSYTVTGLNPTTTYYFKVQAANNVCSSNTLTANATTLQPECPTPGAPTVAASATSTGATGTITAPSGGAVGYVIVRSISSALSAAPANFSTYTVGASIGSGNVIAVGTSTNINDTSANSNTHYYYFIYAYNSGSSCSGPVYSTSAATFDVTTCVGQALVVGASNIRNSSATLNWNSVTGGGASAITYNLEVFTDASYTTSFTSFTGLTATKQAVTGLTANAVYYYRVSAIATGTCASTYSTGSFTATNGYTPIDVTSGGYNKDVIANGSGAAQYSTTAPVDADAAGARNAYVARNYISGTGTPTTVGLPINRFLSSTTTSGLNFIIPDYSGNNCLRLAGQNDTGTLTFETPVKLTDIYIAATGGSGDLVASAEIIFEDGGTSQLSTSIAIPDWVVGTGSIIVDNLGRANMSDTTGNVETIASKIFQIAIPVNTANQTRKVAAVKFTKTSDGPVEPVLNIFAISGKIIGDCPTMASTSVVSTGANGANIAWVLSTQGDGGTPTYTVEVYTDAAFTTSAASPATGLTATTYSITGLTAQTTYYYRVKAINAACESGYVTGTFTTSQVPATLNYTEGFEGESFWSLVNTGQTNKWFIGTATSSSGTKSLYVSNDGGATNGYDLTSISVVQAYRDITIPAGTSTVEFSFDWKGYGESGYDYLRVWMVPTSFIPTAGTQITSGSGRIQIGGNLLSQNTYTNYYTPTLDVSTFAGQTVRLVFEWRNDNSFGQQPSASVDNISMKIPTCFYPVNLTAVAVTTTADISWTAPSVVPANGYEYYYSTTNTTPVASFTGTPTTGTSVSLTGLTTNSKYYWWVRSVCSDSDKSSWSPVGIFFTGACAPTYTTCDSTHRITLLTVPQASFTDDLSGITACSATAINRTSLSIPVTTGNTYTFNVTSIGWIGVGMAIDYNGDGNFDDANETVALPNYIDGNSVIYTITAAIPSSLTPGNYTVRIWNRLANAGLGTPAASACGSYAYGTYVEYTLAVAAPCFNWTGTANTEWNNTANWCGGTVPTSSSDVTITTATNNPVISTGTASVHNLTIAEGATLTVATGATLNVDNLLSVNPAGTLTVADNGALVQGAATTVSANSGNIVFHKKGSSLYRSDYTIWSSPVAGQNLQAFSPATVSNRFYEYKTATDVYASVTPGDNNFEPAKGYLIRMPNADATAGYNDGATAIKFDGTFTGVPNNGTITRPLATTGGRYNAIGNPYPSPINLYDFFYGNAAVIDASSGVYLWRKKNNASSSSYATLNLAAFVANPAQGGGAENNQFYAFDPSTGSSNWLLAPGQGFIVRTLTGLTNPEVTFTNSMRRGTPGSSQSFFRQGADTASRLWINLSSVAAGNASQTAIAYMDNATMDIDFGYDATKFTENNALSVYTLAQQNPLTIQARPVFTNTDVVPMGYNAPQAGTYTIAIDHANGVFQQGQAVYIKDNAEGIIRSLNDNSYSFATEAGTFDNRFELLYTTQALGTDQPLDANTVAVFKQGSSIHVNAGSALVNGITIYDIRGAKVYSVDNVNNTEAVINNLTAEQQVLIVEVNTTKGKVSKRVIF